MKTNMRIERSSINATSFFLSYIVDIYLNETI